MNNEKIGTDRPTEQTLASQHTEAKRDQRNRLNGLAFAYEGIAVKLLGHLPLGIEENPSPTDISILSFEQELSVDWNETNDLIHRLNQALERISRFI